MVLPKQLLENIVVNKEVNAYKIGPASIDLEITDSILVDNTTLDVYTFTSGVYYTTDIFKEITKNANGIFIPAKTFALASTKNIVSIPKDCCAFVSGRSSIGRQGLFVENAGFVDPGFSGTITLELFNATNHGIYLEPMCYAQLIVMKLVEETTAPYNSVYLNQNETQPAIAH